jgi:hypothetical protein
MTYPSSAGELVRQKGRLGTRFTAGGSEHAGRVLRPPVGLCRPDGRTISRYAIVKEVWLGS